MRRRALLAPALVALTAAGLALAEDASDAESEANEAFRRFERARQAALEGDEAERYAAYLEEMDAATDELRSIEDAVVSAVRAERAALWGAEDEETPFVWLEYSEDRRERRRVDFAAETLVFESLDRGLDRAEIRDRVRTALVEGTADAFRRDRIAQGIETRARSVLAGRDALETGEIGSVPVLWPLLTGENEVDPEALEAVVGLLAARAEIREVAVGAEAMQQVEIPLDPATVLAQLEALQSGAFAAPMPEIAPQEIPRPGRLPAPRPETTPPAPRRPPPLPRRFPTRARAYLASVDRHAGPRRLDPALVFAIIETESAFNPLARSPAPAYGLMQIVPRSAGRDASAVLFGRPRLLAPSYLYDPDRNIQVGAVYLDLVMNRYLSGIRDARSRLYCAIAAYNTGAGNVFRAFTGSTRPKAAFRAINRRSPEDVYRHLIWELPYAETRRYLANVVQRMEKYRR